MAIIIRNNSSDALDAYSLQWNADEARRAKAFFLRDLSTTEALAVAILCEDTDPVEIRNYFVSGKSLDLVTAVVKARLTGEHRTEVIDYLKGRLALCIAGKQTFYEETWFGWLFEFFALLFSDPVARAEKMHQEAKPATDYVNFDNLDPDLDSSEPEDCPEAYYKLLFTRPSW